jgi:hypothetical protein
MKRDVVVIGGERMSARLGVVERGCRHAFATRHAVVTTELARGEEATGFARECVKEAVLARAGGAAGVADVVGGRDTGARIDCHFGDGLDFAERLAQLSERRGGVAVAAIRGVGLRSSLCGRLDGSACVARVDFFPIIGVLLLLLLLWWCGLLLVALLEGWGGCRHAGTTRGNESSGARGRGCGGGGGGGRRSRGWNQAPTTDRDVGARGTFVVVLDIRAAVLRIDVGADEAVRCGCGRGRERGRGAVRINVGRGGGGARRERRKTRRAGGRWGLRGG